MKKIALLGSQLLLGLYLFAQMPYSSLPRFNRWLNNDELLKLVTSQYFSILFYAAPLWMGSLTCNLWKRINSAHYRALRAAIGDYKSTRKRSIIDQETKRAPPSKWAHYIVCSTVIKLYNQSDTNIANLIRESVYVNDRMPMKAKFINRS